MEKRQENFVYPLDVFLFSLNLVGYPKNGVVFSNKNYKFNDLIYSIGIIVFKMYVNNLPGINIL